MYEHRARTGSCAQRLQSCPYLPVSLIAFGIDLPLFLPVLTVNEQLDKLDDGMGNVIADGEHMTREEAEDAQARGELYDTYL